MSSKGAMGALPPSVLPSSGIPQNRGEGLPRSSMGAAQTVSLPPPYAWPDLTHHATVSPLLVPGTKRCPDLTEARISTQGHDFQGSGVGGGQVFCSHSSRRRDAPLPVTGLLDSLFPRSGDVFTWGTWRNNRRPASLGSPGFAQDQSHSVGSGVKTLGPHAGTRVWASLLQQDRKDRATLACSAVLLFLWVCLVFFLEGEC